MSSSPEPAPRREEPDEKAENAIKNYDVSAPEGELYPRLTALCNAGVMST